MIIKCAKCETSFRFGDELMTGEGVWVRCCRCTNVFFQDNPNYVESDSLAPEATAETDGPASGKQPALQDAAEDTPLQNPADAGKKTTAAEPLPARVEEIREIMAAETRQTALRSAIFEDLEALTIEEIPSDEAPAACGRANKLAVIGKVMAYFFLVLSIIVLLAGLSLWIFPEARQQAAEILSPYFYLPEGFGKEQKTTDSATAQLLLQDVRQHLVNNWTTGNLWVVEGAAVNKGRYALTHVQIQGRLYDHNGIVLRERASFGGNLLTDAELATMTEEDILKRLTQLPGGGLSVSRLAPGEQLPFMIVMAHEQTTVAKTTVKVVGAEKLLE